jgi:hypothetical protein
MDPVKVTTIQEWPTPMNVKDVQSFLGFANFYRHFIRDYSAIVATLTRLTRKDTAFVWDIACTDSFATLKHAFTTAPILRHFNYDREAIVETDASDYISAGILSQYDDEGILHPVAFFSKKHSPAECNYEIYDKELMTIVRGFEEWRPELEGASHPIKVLSDHKNLEYFMSTKLLNRRQTHWAEYLSRFNFKMVYRPGKAGAKPDSLTHRSGDLPQGGDDRLIEQHKAVLKLHNLSDELQLWEAVLAAPRSALSQDILKATQTDPFAQWIITALFEGTQHRQEITLSECQVHNGCLYYQHCLYVPADDALRLRIIQNNHDVPAAGHPGRAKTFDLIRRRYFWPTLRKDVERFVANCHVCQRTKTSRHIPYGVLNPLPVPKRPWRDISMDFVTGLPISDGHNAIWVVIDRLTKMRHFVPCSTTVDAKELANLFVTNIFRLHGLPDSIISD